MLPEANLLRDQQSPYLLQHADNPVHWRPWSREAMIEAQQRHRPILLSIGYAACHWCHVMAHESFEDPETAALMNELFVNIKVDREERPDIDHIYMSALHALGQQGGWPLTMFLSPEGAPFWGGTYFPPEPRWGRPSFRQVLQGVADAWRNGDGAIAQNGAALSRALAEMTAAQPGEGLTPAELGRISGALLRLVDLERGGLRGAPKFPNAPIFRFLWQEAWRSGWPEYATAVRRLLERMSQGGIHDHLGGGYARYATDANWLVPHFEKMLYDNAQLLELLAFAHAAAPDPLFNTAAAGIVGWLQRDMWAAGAFAASEDADSEGEEGKFYVWTEAEIDAVLGDASPAFKAAYDVTAEGNWEGRTILHRVGAAGSAAAESALERARALLFAARERRVRPGRDDKILADWNGLAVAALCRAGAVFEHPEWHDLAARVFDAIRVGMTAPDGRSEHAARHGRVTAAGLLDDQAAMARAAIALFEASGEAGRLAQAIGYARAAITHFAANDGSFYLTADDAADVPAVRPRRAADDATPNGNGLMAEVFARLYHLTGDAEWRDRAAAVIRAFSGAGDQLAGMPTLLAAADLLEAAATVVVAGPAGLPATEALLHAARTAPDPAVVTLHASEPDAVAAGHPAHGKWPQGEAAAYLCRAGTCSLPITDPVALTAALRERDR